MPAELLADASPAIGCPKHMEYGPCGGVEFDGNCEVAPHPCVFLGTPTVLWHGVSNPLVEPVETGLGGGVSNPLVEPVETGSWVSTGSTSETGSRVSPGSTSETGSPGVSSGSARMRELLTTRAIVVADFPAAALSAESITECAAVLVGSVDAVLAGDAGSARVQFPPAYRAHLIQSAGLAVWAGLNCRDRNRVAIEGELAALAHVGVAGIHSVTGDHTLTGSRPDASPVFDLDSTELAALAAAAGLLVSVAEAPASPPVERRPARLIEKERAGAEICFVNHAGGVEPVRAFIGAARALGSTLGFIPCIPIVIDRESAELLKSFTTLVLPAGYLDEILAAETPADMRAAGIAAAVELGHGFLAIDGVVGVNLSGGSTSDRAVEFAAALAEIGRALAPSLTHR
ncbi:MAG: methylenetetrahydrofolate reductase C-terminal domain-containing protein, partial [Actinomycetota bacterium]|nr:methylenetetrahydrofolate reductase C-terminal domain-containing protein [Actinomycetota bacterium]